MSDLDNLLAFLAKQPDMGGVALAERRKLYDRAEKAFALPPGTTARPWSGEGIEGEWIETDNAEAGRGILYLHGGGYGIGSPRSHRHLAAAIARAARAPVLVPDYRLAPEHRFPAALDDALLAYRALGRSADRIAVMGDSAGGGLAVAALLKIQDQRLPAARAGVCLSPWADLTAAIDGPVAAAAARDPVVKFEHLADYAAAYLGSAHANHPYASPIFGNLHGLPPLLIQASAAEALRFDAVRLAEVARQAGVATTLELVPGVPHVWHWFWPRLDLGRSAIERIGQFVEPLLAA